MIYVRKINKIPEFYMLLSRKIPEFYMIIARKYVSRFFSGEGGGGHVPPAPNKLPMTIPDFCRVRDR